MKISINWLHDYLNISNTTYNEIAEKFTLHTCEVDAVDFINQHLEKTTIVEIVHIEPHPDSDHLNLVSFTNGLEIKKVVCGAPNVRLGLKVPFAPIGTTLPGGFTLTAKKIRGILSEGMLCSEPELSLGADDSGLMELPTDSTLGQTMAEYAKVSSDAVLDIDNKSLTHRPDLWGHYGMARELSCLYQQDLKPLNVASGEEVLSLATDSSPITITNIGDNACQYALGLSVDGLEVKPSPLWLQQRLQALGHKPINNIVDISNYVMFELGIPNHIYDRTLIDGSQISIKALDSALTFTALDDKDYEMQTGDTLLFDETKAIGIAGIMGGKYSSIQEDTKEIFIEVANWTDYKIRKVSTRIGLRTDASMRYEKSLDSHLCRTALLLLLSLLKESCPQIQVKGSIVGGESHWTLPATQTVAIDPKKINKLLGTQISDVSIRSTLNHLGFTESSSAWKFTIPSYRATKDIAIEADIAEEIGRIYGYDNIVPISPTSALQPIRLQPLQRIEREVKQFMVFHGYSLEVMSYPLVGSALLEQADWPHKNVDLVLKNAISQDHNRMRPSLVPSSLQTLIQNSKHFDTFNFFEYGRNYQVKEGNPLEKTHLVAIQYSQKKTNFTTLLSTAENLFKSLALPLKIKKQELSDEFIPQRWPLLHPFEQYNLVSRGKTKGVIFSIHPLWLKKFKIKGHASLLLLDLDALISPPKRNSIQFKEIVRQPIATFDCTVYVPQATEAEDIIKAIHKAKIRYLSTVLVCGIYNDNETHKSITLQSTLQKETETLSSEELKVTETNIIKALENSGYFVKMKEV